MANDKSPLPTDSDDALPLDATITQPPTDLGETIASVDRSLDESISVDGELRDVGDALPPTVPEGESAVRRPMRFGDYDIERELARGGMGVVFRARQVSLNRPVALKMILASRLASAEEVQRFYLEAEAAAHLNHPGIVPIYEVGKQDDQHFFAMELVEGGALADFIKDGPLDSRRAAELVMKIATAVQYAHARNIVHRDLKPANILINDSGQPKVTDFGLAKNVEGSGGLTATGEIMGTPSYMPPEQARGDMQAVGPLADVYALGAILYFLVVGRPPFEGANLMDTLKQVLEQEPIAPRRHNERVDRDLETICLKCLRKEPESRYTSAAELAEELRRYLSGEPITARPVGRVERTAKWVKRNKAISAALTAAVLALVSGTGVAIWKAKVATDAQTTAHELYTSESRALAAEKSARRKERAAQYALDLETLPLVWQAGNVDRAREMLNRHQKSLRGFEWHYWDRKVHAERRSLVLPGLLDAGHENSPTQRDWAFSADGSRVALLQTDGRRNPRMTLTVWDVATRKRLAHIDKLAPIAWDFRRNLTLSRDGKRVLIGGRQVVDVERNRVLFGPSFLKAQGLRATRVGLSPDGTTCFALVRRSNAARPKEKQNPLTLKVWDLQTRAELLSKPTGNAVPDFSPNGRRILAVDPSGAESGIRMWDLTNGKELWKTKGRESFVHSADGKLLAGAALNFDATGRGTLTVRVLDAATGMQRSTTSLRILKKVKRKFAVDYTEQLVFSPDGSQLATCYPTTWYAASQQIPLRWFLIDSLSGDLLASPTETDFNVHSTAPEPVNPFFLPDGKAFGWTAHSGIKRIEVSTETRLETLWGHGKTVAACVLTPDGRRLWSVARDGTLKEWDLQPPAPVRLSLPGFAALATSADARWIARTSMTGEVIVADAKGRAEPAKLRLRPTGGRPGLSPNALSRDGKRVAVLRHKGEQGNPGVADLSVWDVARKVEVLNKTFASTKMASGLGRVSLSPSGDRVAVVLWSRKPEARHPLRIYDIATGELQQSDPFAHAITQFEFSPDGTKLAAFAEFTSADATKSMKLVVWDATTARRIQTIDLSAGPRQVSRIAWSPESTRIAVSGNDKGQVLIRVYDVASGAMSLELDRSQRFSAFQIVAIDLAFSPDGRRIAYYSRFPKAVNVHDSRTGKQLLTLPVRGEELAWSNLAFSADGSRLRLVRVMRRDKKVSVKTWDGSPRLPRATAGPSDK